MIRLQTLTPNIGNSSMIFLFSFFKAKIPLTLMQQAYIYLATTLSMASRARNIRDRTVPTGQSMTSAICS